MGGMATLESMAETVKDAITSGRASDSTVTTLQSLLSSVPGNESQSISTVRTSTKTTGPSKVTRKGAPSKPANKKSQKDQDFKIHDEESARSLAPKARYALATEIVNIGLKALPQTSLGPPKGPERSSSATERALQSRSGNATPGRQHQTKSTKHEQERSGSPSHTTAVSAHFKAAAECTRVSFSYLRSVDFVKLGVRPLPRYQLENGMLSLAGRMINAGLDHLAVKELRIIKRRLGQACSTAESQPKTIKTSVEGRETLASLLRTDFDLTTKPEIVPSVVTYQLNVLRVIARSPKPATVEEASHYLGSDVRGSPVQAINLLAETNGDLAKASRQLESVANLILQLCPSASASADEAARDPNRSPRPVTVFRLHMHTLKIRQEIWKLVGHRIDVEKDLAEPFSKCLGALTRRLSGQKHTSELYKICEGAYNDLGLNVVQLTDRVGGSATFSNLRTLFVLAHKADLHDEAYAWAELATKQCTASEGGHARLVASSVMKLSSLLARTQTCGDPVDLAIELDAINHRLKAKLTGNLTDFEMLLDELARLIRYSESVLAAETLRTPWRTLCFMSAGFASRYAKSFPDNESCKLASHVIAAAVSQSRTTEDLLSWATKEAGHVFIRMGAFEKVCEVASTRSLTQAWSSSTVTFALSRILKALIARAASDHTGSGVPTIIDEELVPVEHLGTFLETLLHQIMELAHKRKYQPCLQTILLDITTRLDSTYSVDSHPICRARVAALYLRGGEQFPEVFAPEAVQIFLQSPAIDPSSLAKDEELKGYVSDINASLAVAKAFHNRRPEANELTESLSIWQALLAAPEHASSLKVVVDNPRVLTSQLIALEGYLGVLGEDLLRADVAQLLCDAGERCGATTSEQCSFATMLATAHMSLGFSERAGEVLERARSMFGAQNFKGPEALEYHICRAETLCSLDQYADGQNVLEDARKAKSALEQQKYTSSQTMSFSLLHGRDWLLESQLMLALGRPEESLRSAKSAVKLLSGIWSKLERSADHTDSSRADQDAETESVDNLTNKISKLNLKPANTSPSQCPDTVNRKGAAFWPVTRVLCSAFLQLADVYAHHGIFNEANYASEQAVKTAEAMQASQLLCRVRYHRSVLLTAAGRTEDAELCLAQDNIEAATMQPLTRIERLRAQAALASKNGEFDSALKSVEQAMVIARTLQSSHVSPMASKSQVAVSVDGARGPVPPTKTTKRPGRQVAPAKTSRSKASSKPSTKLTTSASPTEPYVHRKLESRLQLEKAMLFLKMGRKANDELSKLADTLAAYPATFQWRQLEYESFMHQLGTVLEADFAFNALPETTLSFPALQHPAPNTSTAVAATSSTSRTAKPTKRKVSVPAPFESLLSGARQCMTLEGQPMQALTTSEVHKQSAMASNASLLLSATSSSQTSATLHPVREALSLDIARIHAARCQNAITALEREALSSSDLTSWPCIESSQPQDTLTATTFQHEFIDIIPASWTAVSMSLNEDCSELFVSRYRHGQPPIILRLPYLRQKSEEAEDDMFDYAIGKAELADIIELSNYSCHSSVETNVKGAKTNWWSEREALDLRLQELLINIENIWLGGFRGIFSQHRRDVDQLSRFRKAFDAVLGRHLPSRRAPKRGSKTLALDDQVLELFIGLGNDDDGQIDLDEPLSDLLYFVVDMLQFNGERNAYDEIDFDSMSIEVLDALRSYHDSTDETDQDTAHLILVLDRRLHAFPWESLPCLQSSNVSRVDSMLTLRDRILEMRSAMKEQRYTVSKRTGSYILNPGGDLKGTESTMAPELTKLTRDEGAEWTSIVRREPTEDEFRTALQTSATLMYFGHGSGAQYIRPRAIRKLEKCSEVVWLMGCSSGAVQEHDELEPYAVPLAYMAAGRQSELPSSSGNIEAQNESRGKCMAVLATLWDVTDKDIDRFSLAVGEEWGLWRPPPETTKLPVKTPKKRVIAAPVTPQKAAKTPKTPKAKQTPAVPRTPARGGSRQALEAKGTRSLVEAVAKSRDACYLRYLNGAAPVVYGVPVWLGD